MPQVQHVYRARGSRLLVREPDPPATVSGYGAPVNKWRFAIPAELTDWSIAVGTEPRRAGGFTVQAELPLSGAS